MKERKELPPSAESPHVRAVARDIVVRAEKTVGPTYWSRLVIAGRLVECRAILCVDMIKDRGADSLPMLDERDDVRPLIERCEALGREHFLAPSHAKRGLSMVDIEGMVAA